MFGFLKKTNPADLLIAELNKVILHRVEVAIKECPVEMLQGTYITMAIKVSKDVAIKNVHALSLSFNIPTDAVYKLIDKCHKDALNYFIES